MVQEDTYQLGNRLGHNTRALSNPIRLFAFFNLRFTLNLLPPEDCDWLEQFLFLIWQIRSISSPELLEKVACWLSEHSEDEVYSVISLQLLHCDISVYLRNEKLKQSCMLPEVEPGL